MRTIILMYVIYILLSNSEEYGRKVRKIRERAEKLAARRREGVLYVLFCCMIPVFIAVGIVRGLALRLLREVRK